MEGIALDQFSERTLPGIDPFRDRRQVRQGSFSISHGGRDIRFRQAIAHHFKVIHHFSDLLALVLQSVGEFGEVIGHGPDLRTLVLHKPIEPIRCTLEVRHRPVETFEAT